MQLGEVNYAELTEGQRLAVKYFTVAMVLFLAQMLFGLLAAWQFIDPTFLFEILDFNVNRMVHINAMVVWMLYGFIGSIYWLVEDESGVPLVGVKLGNSVFWVLTIAVSVVVVVYLLVQSGPGEPWSLWLINEGREYIEAPRWADIGIVLCMAGVWGFMQTLPQINLYTHGTQWSSSHGHLAFFGAYVTIIVAFIYLAIQKLRGNVWMSGGTDGAWRWKWSMVLLHVGMVGMTIALLIAGYEQAFIERAVGGSTWQAYFEGQLRPWFVQAMQWRMAFGVVMTAGVVLLLWDFIKIGAGESRMMKQVG